MGMLNQFMKKKSLKCNLCDAAFSFKASLKVHNESHFMKRKSHSNATFVMQLFLIIGI